MVLKWVLVLQFVWRSAGRSPTHPNGSLSSVRLLQSEDLRHHVVSSGMQQDPTGGQPDHDIAAHWRQAYRDGIWACWRKINHCNQPKTFIHIYRNKKKSQSLFKVQWTKSLGVEHLSQVVWSQRVDCQYALIWETSLAAWDEDRQQLTVCRDVTAGIVVDLTVWHQNIDRGWKTEQNRQKIVNSQNISTFCWLNRNWAN